MKVKRILKFYFTADSLDRAFDNLLLRYACAYEADGLKTAEKLCGLIEERGKLNGLWSYLDGIISGLPDGDRVSLKSYSLTRCGIKTLDNDKRCAIKRALMKFKRRAYGIRRFAEEIELVGKYYCLLTVCDNAIIYPDGRNAIFCP